jgi:glycosyltransferase involved in cell wall biosynthesis
MRASDQPRILLIEGALRDNGGLRLTHEMAMRWHRAGVPVRLLVLETVEPDGPMFVPDPELPIVYGSARVRRFRNAVFPIASEVLRHARRSDVVVSASEVGWGMFLGWIAARVTRRPFVALVQSSLDSSIDAWRPRRLHGALRWLHRRVDRAVCVSPGLMPGVVANGLPSSRVSVFQPGIDYQATRNRVVGERHERSERRTQLVAMGRLAHQKGFDVLVRAIALARVGGAEIEVVILGDGPDKAELEALTRSEGVSEAVRFEGFVTDPHPYLSRADAFVLSSRFEGNGSGALLEALAHGLPVIATDCVTGPRFVLRDGQIGVLVPVENPGALADAIRAFVEDPSDLRERATFGPARAAEFDHGTASKELLQIVNAVARGQSPEPSRFSTASTKGANELSHE